MTKLYAPELYWTLTAQAKAEICNGCGSAQAKFDFVPDTPSMASPSTRPATSTTICTT